MKKQSWILLSAVILMGGLATTRVLARGFEHMHVEEERRFAEERRLAEIHRLEMERRYHPVAVYAPAPVVIAPPPTGVSLVIPISFH